MNFRCKLQNLVAFALFCCATRTPPSSAWSTPSLHTFKLSRRCRHYFVNSNHEKITSPSSELFNAATTASVISDAPEESAPINNRFFPGPEITFGSSGIKLNWFGAAYGLWAISSGLVNYFWLKLYELIKIIMPDSFDPTRRVATPFTHFWGMLKMRLFHTYPIIDGVENLELLYDKESKKYRNAMFVANHCSWLDIPYVVMAVGIFRNYKIVAKHELLKIPVLSQMLRSSDHVLLDRTSRRSQFDTFKKGVTMLKTDGVCLVTFAEGTRSRSGVMGEFKSGAFKMAQSAGVPLVPLAISYTNEIWPPHYAWPMRPGRLGKRKGAIHVCKPIETEGKDDDELVEELRESLIKHLPASQRPKA